MCLARAVPVRMLPPSRNLRLTVPLALLPRGAAPDGGGHEYKGQLRGLAVDLVFAADEALSVSTKPAHEAGAEAEAEAEAHLLGPARWRQAVLRSLGLLLQPLRQRAWERAAGPERRQLLARAVDRALRGL